MNTERLSAALADRYTIERELGAGGMATVYLAEDLKHDRKVALKVLKPELAAVVGADRFLAEIRTTANLQHPHILPLFDSGEADGFLFYVMPYVAGESLRERLDREKQLPVEEAVDIARRVATALQAAHDEGVIHRDIKPANILLQKGEPVVADFGIAIAVQEAGGRLTETGLSLGTPWYMSPEQASADRAVDGRTDVYSLACVLYEMLAGEPPYVGGSAQAVLARILTSRAEPVTGHRASVPENVSAALEKGLERLAADRFASAAEFSGALGDPAFRYSATRGSGAGGVRGSRAPWAVAAAALAVAAAAWLWPEGSSEPGSGTVPRVVPIRSSAVMERDVDISDDGSILAYACEPEGARAVCVMDLATGEERVVSREPGSTPELSPDGRRVAFISRLRLLVVDVESGEERVVADVRGVPWQIAWARGDSILFIDEQSGIVLVSEAGGTPRTVVPIGRMYDFRGLEGLPGGDRALLMSRDPLQVGEVDRRGWIGVLDLNSGEIEEIAEGVAPRFIPGGYLLYSRGGGRAMVVRFDPRTGRPTSEAVPAPDHFPYGSAGRIAVGWRRSGRAAAPVELVRYSDPGGIDRLPITEGAYHDPRLSPSGDRVAVVEPLGGEAPAEEGVISVIALESGRLLRIADGGEPAWDSEGAWLYYKRGGEVWRTPSDGSVGQERVAELDGEISLGGVTGSGDVIVRVRAADDRILRVGPEGADTLLVAPTAVAMLRVSDDGAWIAYNLYYGFGAARSLHLMRVADRSVVQLPGLSTPVFSSDSRRLWANAYDQDSGGDQLVAVALSTDGEVGEPTPPQRLPEGATLRSGWPWQINYDVFPDDDGLLFRYREEEPEVDDLEDTLLLILDLPAALERALREGGA